MLKQFKITAVILLAVFILCGGVQAAVTESNSQTYPLGNIYTIIYSADSVSDGGYLLGTYHDGTISIVKTDSNGKTIWSADAKGDYVHAVKSVSDGGCVALTSEGDNSYLYRFDKNGNKSWETPLIDISVGINPIVVKEGTIKLAGWFSESKRGFTQTYALSNGAPANDQITLSDDFVPVSIIADGESYILVGETDTTIYSFNSSAWILKMRDGGVVEWKTVIRTECESPDIYGPGSAAFVVCKADDGGYFVSGTGSAFNTDATNIQGILWAAKINSAGAVEWHKDLKGATPYGVSQIGAEYVVAGVGWNSPMWMTVTENGAITQLKYTNDYTGAFYAFTEVSKNTAAAAGWYSKTGAFEGYLVEFSDKDVKPTATPAPVLGIIIGLGCAGLLIRRKLQ